MRQIMKALVLAGAAVAALGVDASFAQPFQARSACGNRCAGQYRVCRAPKPTCDSYYYGCLRQCGPIGGYVR